MKNSWILPAGQKTRRSQRVNTIYGGRRMNRKLGAGEAILLVILAIAVIIFMVKKEANEYDGSDTTEQTRTVTSSETNDTKKTTDISKDSKTDEVKDEVKDEPKDESKEVVYPTIEYGIIYDDQGIKIETTEYTETAKNITLKYRIENNCGVTALVDTAGVAVNGYMIQGEMDSGLYTTVGNGKKANATLTIDKDKYKLYGIEQTKRIEIQFHFQDDDDAVFDIDNCRPNPSVVLTSADDGNYPNVEGNTIYDEGGIKVDYISDDNNKYCFLIRNNTGGFFRLFGLTDYFAVNDYSIQLDDTTSWTDFFYETIFDGDALMIELDLSNKLKENGISSVDSIEFTLECSTPGKYYGNNDTGTIKYTK